ncbi:MAG: DMT family protein [Nitrospira sp.]|nr:DMT family protein [Nitrospira sp.]
MEYCFQVPANRIGHYEFSAAQLKTIQEVITLIVFCVFMVENASIQLEMELLGTWTY